MSDKRTKISEEDTRSIEASLDSCNINYDSSVYYYAPLTLYPRSITPKVDGSKVEMPNLAGFNTMIYIHTAYCSTECSFCPFFKETASKVPEEYVEGLASHLRLISKQIERLPKEYTIYFGGGSPNLLTPTQIERIMDAISNHLHGKSVETTIELHPEVANKKGYLKNIVSLGINRISFGFQSYNRNILRETRRHHGPETLDRLLDECAALGIRTNVDLMFGGFIDENFEDDISTFERAFSLPQPTWITVYQVITKQGTSEFERFTRNKEKYPNTRAILKARSIRHKIAEEHGFLYLGGDYFARESSNLKYQERKWGDKTAQIAIGAGSYTQIIDGEKSRGLLLWQPFNIKEYLKMVASENLPVTHAINYSSEETKSWIAAAKLKTRQPLSIQNSPGIYSNVKSLESHGVIKGTEEGFFISDKGILIEDLVCASLLPKEIWERAIKRQSSLDYSSQVKYDWCFDPLTVRKFQRGIFYS